MRAMVHLSPRMRRWLLFAALFVLYFAIACLITWPLISCLGGLLVGRTTDAMVHYWNGWWFQEALRLGQSPFQTTLLNYPDGVSLVTHNFALLNILPWLLLEPLLGGITAYNLIVLLSLALCGFAMYLLAEELLSNAPAAFIAGLIYMAWPFRLSQLDHPNLLATFWIPLFFLFLIRTLRRRRWQDALVAGVALALVGYTRWQLLVPVSFMTGIYVLGSTKQWLASWKQMVPLLALTAGVALIALLPPAVMLAKEQTASNLAADVIYQQDEQSMSTDLLAYITPSKRHFILKEITKPVVDRYYPDRTPGRRYPTYIGIAVLLLAAFGLAKRWRETWIWLVMALVLIGLAAGMAWRVNGQFVTAVPTLYKLLAPLQVARLMRIPERYVMFLALPASLLAAYGWVAVITNKRLARWSSILTLLLSLVILFEYQSAPLQSQYTAYDTSVFEKLAAEPGDFAILNLPLRYRFSKEYMYEQTIHGRPILQGHVSREPENLYRFIMEREWLSRLPELVDDPGTIMSQLHEAGVGYVILSKYLLEDATWRLWKRHMPYAPYYSDERYLVYATAPEYGRDLEQPELFAPGIGFVEESLTSFCSTEQITAVVTATWATTAPPSTDYAVQLIATSEKTGQQQEGPVLPLVEGWPTSAWPSGTVTRQSYAINLPAADGPYTLSLQAVDKEQDTLSSTPLGEGPAGGTACTIDAGEAAAANVLFGESLQLLAYQTAQDGRDLQVTLYWLGRQRPVDAYKFFIHVQDPETKEVVAQIDTMPLNYSLPTSDWKSGELVADEIALSLAGLAAGSYELAIGVYDVDTGERLPLSAATGTLQIGEDRRLMLPELVQVSEE